MAIDAFVKSLLSLPLFRGLKPMQITEIARRADRIVYRPGDAIIKEDEAGDAAIVIISGEAARMSGADVAEVVTDGAMIAELAMLVETVHGATVVATSTVRALRISRSEMHALMHDDLSLAEHFSLRISERLKRLALELRAVDDALTDVTGLNLPARRLIDATHQPSLVH